MSWIIDTDGGIDDCQALVLALGTQGFQVHSIATIFGNTNQPNVYRNIKQALRVCERQQIPIYRGATRPIIGPAQNAEYAHGQTGLGNYWDSIQDLSQHPIQSKQAYQILLQSQGKNLITLGPLTNLAIALLINPQLTFERLVIMGGTRQSNGNVGPVQQFNIFADPEAAKIVFERGKNIELVPWEACVQDTNYSEHPDLFDGWFVDTAKGSFMKKITEWGIEKFGGLCLCDPSAMAVAIDPTVACESEEFCVLVECSGTLTRGQTVVYKSEFCESPPKNTVVVKRLDWRKLKELLVQSVFS